MKKWLCLCLALFALLPASAGAEEYVVSFVGDVSIGEAYQFRGNKEGYTWMLDQNGMDWPFSLVRERLEGDDFTFANLECVFTERTKHRTDVRWALGALPKYAEALLYSGIDAVNTVNNHCFDYYLEGYQDTMATLDALPFSHFGTMYLSNKSRKQDLLLEVEANGIKIGAIGYSVLDNPGKNDAQMFEERIKQLRADGCQLIVVAMHWGRETRTTPQSWEPAYAKKLIDLGVDVVWGAHPHVLQPVQFYHGGVILYSTGNFSFGTIAASVDPDTGIFQVVYERDAEDHLTLKRLQVIPCINTRRGDYRVHELTEEADRRRVFKKLIYSKSVQDMYNLPASFIETGVVELVDGVPVE